MSDRKKNQRPEPRQLTSAEFAKLSSSGQLALFAIRRAQASSRLAVAALRLASTGRE